MVVSLRTTAFVLMASRKLMLRGLFSLMYSSPDLIRLAIGFYLTYNLGVQELVCQLEMSEEDRRKISYDLDSEKNERRRLQQLVDQLTGDLKSVKVGINLEPTLASRLH